MAEHIVRRALDLLMELPDAPAMTILDRAMEGVSGHVSFENLSPFTRDLWSDHLDPPAPFAELVRRAFAPRFDPHVWILLAVPELGGSASTDQHAGALEIWQDVLERFAKRYRLWDA
jgi:hypothetical protein